MRIVFTAAADEELVAACTWHVSLEEVRELEAERCGAVVEAASEA